MGNQQSISEAVMDVVNKSTTNVMMSNSSKCSQSNSQTQSISGSSAIFSYGPISSKASKKAVTSMRRINSTDAPDQKYILFNFNTFQIPNITVSMLIRVFVSFDVLAYFLFKLKDTGKRRAAERNLSFKNS